MLTVTLLALLAALALVACSTDAPLPTLAPAAEPLPATPVPLLPTLPPPAIITIPSGAVGTSAISVPAGNASSPAVIHIDAAGSALPDEVQRLLDDLASGTLMLNSSPAGQGGEPVNYAYRDLNGDGSRDLVVIVVAESLEQTGPDAAEPVQAIGINLDELVASISESPEAPLIRSAFVYTLSQEELDQLEGQ